MKTIIPNLQHARKINELLDHGLVKGKGDPEPGKMCVEAAVCFALGLPHGDNPPCVGSAVRSFKIALNESPWSCDLARGEGMRKLAIAQLGSDEIDQMEFGKMVYLRGVQKLLPIVFRKTAEDVSDDRGAIYLAHADAMEKCLTFEDAQRTAKAASASAYAYASASESEFFEKHLGDEYLAIIAKIGLDCLIELKSPGCEWLYLCEK